MPSLITEIELLDVSTCSYPMRLCAAALQGLINRSGPLLFLDYGIYDDPAARRTNEVFMDDDLWYGQYRDMLGNQDLRNLEYYQQEHVFQVRRAAGLEELICKYRERLSGYVVWESNQPDTANLALMFAAQEDLLLVESSMAAWAEGLGLTVRHDLRGQWQDRVDLYAWAFQHLFPQCKPGMVACVEPRWQRPEFVDYLVQNKIFTYSLSSRSGGIGDTLLLLLAFGPAWLCEMLYSLRLDGVVRGLALSLMGWKSKETFLATRIQRTVKADSYPTIFGWHTKRDNELAFMLQLSANGLRLVPSHLAGNFSFHAQVQPTGQRSDPVDQRPDVELDPEGTYVTFTLSDGDQLMMMSTSQLGNWNSPSRGQVPFNWETQPLLVELAPALLEKYFSTAAPNDCLIAGPSGAGYIIPPLAPNLPSYLCESSRVCQKAGIRVSTFYVSDPPSQVLTQLAQHSEGLIGYLGGYAVFDRIPLVKVGKAVFAANQWPKVSNIWDQSGDVLEGVRWLINAPGLPPRFIGVHLFAYRTTIDDIARFAKSLTDPHVHIVRADTFLRLARQSIDSKTNGG